MDDENKENWPEYIDYVEKTIETELKCLLSRNLYHLCLNFGIDILDQEEIQSIEASDSQLNINPIVETQLTLASSELLFSPSVQKTNKHSISSSINRIVESIIDQSKGIERIASNKNDTFR